MLTTTDVIKESYRLYTQQAEEPPGTDLQAIYNGVLIAARVLDDSSKKGENAYAANIMAETGIPGMMLIRLAVEASGEMLDRIGPVAYMLQPPSDATISMNIVSFQTGFGEGASRHAGHSTFSAALTAAAGGDVMSIQTHEDFCGWTSAALGVDYAQLRTVAEITAAAVVAIFSNGAEILDWSKDTSESRASAAMSYTTGFVSGWGFVTNKAMLGIG